MVMLSLLGDLDDMRLNVNRMQLQRRMICTAAWTSAFSFTFCLSPPSVLTHSRSSSCSSWFQGDFPRQQPLRSVQVQTAQSYSDGGLNWNKSIFLQSHSVQKRPLPSPECFFPVGEEKRTATLSETSVHDEGRPLHPRPVTAELITGTLTYRTIFMRLRKLPSLLVCCLVSFNVLSFKPCVFHCINKILYIILLCAS